MILIPLLVSTAEACGGFDWDDAAFERAYAELERSLFGETRAYGALTPLVGLTAGGTNVGRPPSAASRASASILGPLAATMHGYCAAGGRTMRSVAGMRAR